MSIGLEVWKSATKEGVFKHGHVQAVSSEGRQHTTRWL